MQIVHTIRLPYSPSLCSNWNDGHWIQLFTIFTITWVMERLLANTSTILVYFFLLQIHSTYFSAGRWPYVCLIERKKINFKTFIHRSVECFWGADYELNNTQTAQTRVAVCVCKSNRLIHCCACVWNDFDSLVHTRTDKHFAMQNS